MEIVATQEQLNRVSQLIADLYVKKMTGRADQSNIPVNERIKHIANDSNSIIAQKEIK